MKRFLSAALLAAMLLGGCAGQGYKEPVAFCYLRSQYQYGASQGILAWEEREASGHRKDLRYLMGQYLMGPSTEELRAPLPSGTRILSAQQEGTAVTLTLSEVPASMTESAFSLACACLTQTCMGLTNADSVTVVSGSRSVTMDAENLIFTDSPDTNKEEEQQ